MYVYRVVPGVSGVPEMGDLHAVYEEEATRPGEPFALVLSANYEHRLVPYERAVGSPCVVYRTDDDGRTQSCEGSVLSVTPLRVSLAGDGFQ